MGHHLCAYLPVLGGSVQNRCADVLASSGRGRCPWLWCFVPFTAKSALGWPIIRLLLHRLWLQRIRARRYPGGFCRRGWLLCFRRGVEQALPVGCGGCLAPAGRAELG